MKAPLGRPWELILILVLTVFIFSPSFSQSFVSWDDEGHLTENLQVRSIEPSNIAAIFRSEVNRTYIPLTIFSFAIEHYFFGYTPLVYHVTNLLLHLGVVMLVYTFTLRLKFGHHAALLAALLFAVHPMHVESVVWVTQRKDVLYSLFYMLALWQYVIYVQERKTAAFVRAVVFGLLSILSKPMALSLPLVLCLLDWYLKRPMAGRLIAEKFVIALMVWPVAWQTYAMNMRTVDFQFPQSILIWVWCLIFYVLKFIVPAELLVLYQLPQPVGIQNAEYASAILLFLIMIVLVLKFNRGRLFIFALGYLLLSVFFLLRFDNKQDLTVVADRFMYLPSLGICILAGWGIARVMEWSRDHKRELQRFILGCVVLIVFVLCVLTHIRVRMWGNEEALWNQVARRYDSGMAYTQLGNYFLKQKEWSKALEHYEAAVKRLPSYSKPFSNRGIVMLKMGRYQDAVSDFDRAIELDQVPSAVTFNNRGYAHMLIMDHARALDDYNRAIAVDDKYLSAYLNRATLYKNEGSFALSLDDLKKVLTIDPNNEIAKNNIRILKGLLRSVEAH